MRRIWISLVAVGLLVATALVPAMAQDADTVTVDLEEIEDSGFSGTAELTSDDGQTTVSIELSGGDDDTPHPAHIHDGTCENLGDVAYPLEDIENGESETTVDVALDELTSGEYAIN